MKRIALYAALIMLLWCQAAAAMQAAAFNPTGYYRNGYMLSQGRLAKNGYDWWWHSVVAENKATCELRPFFFQYFIINPALGGAEPVLGQLPANKQQGVMPSYAMVRAGTWDNTSSVQISNFYGIDDLSAATDSMDVTIGDNNTATDTFLRGSVNVTPDEAAVHPEYMSDAGEISWNLAANKELSYSLGPATSEILVRLSAFQMFRHVQGMQTRYSGTITYNGQQYVVRPESSLGYQDKNWGSDFPNPWIQLSCNKFKSATTGNNLERTSLYVGGGSTVLFGLPLGQKVTVAFYYQGELYEYNAARLLTNPSQVIDCGVRDSEVYWSIAAWDSDAGVEIDFTCPKSRMLLLNYENRLGQKNYSQLWNGGQASGTVKFYKRCNPASPCYTLMDTLEGSFAGCQYGSY